MTRGRARSEAASQNEFANRCQRLGAAMTQMAAAAAYQPKPSIQMVISPCVRRQYKLDRWGPKIEERFGHQIQVY